MKYFLLSNASDEKGIGKAGFPQCKGIPSGRGLTYRWFEQPNSMTKLTNEVFPDFEPDLIFELEDKALLTDVLSPSNITAKGFLINKKVKDIFIDFHLMEHRYYPAILIVNGKELQYYWLHFIECEDKYLGNINYQRSSFFVSNLAYMKLEDIAIESRDDFWKKKMNLPMKHIRADHIELNHQLLEKGLDLFYIAYIHSDFLVSEKLVKAIKSTKLTGLEISEQNIL